MRRHDRNGLGPAQPLRELKEVHGEIARLLVAGMKQGEIAKRLGFTAGRMSIICHSPAFQDHVATLEGPRNASAMDIKSEIQGATIDGITILRNILRENTVENVEAPLTLKVSVAQDFMNRNLETARVTRVASQSLSMVVTRDDLEAIKAAKRVGSNGSSPAPVVEPTVSQSSSFTGKKGVHDIDFSVMEVST